jgi:hypothetical protein
LFNDQLFDDTAIGELDAADGGVFAFGAAMFDEIVSPDVWAGLWPGDFWVGFWSAWGLGYGFT